jgi:hypothetical protein
MHRDFTSVRSDRWRFAEVKILDRARMFVDVLLLAMEN